MTKEIDNFDILSEKLFENYPMGKLLEDEFYYLQIFVRSKDGNCKYKNGNNKNRLVKYYTITSKEQLLNLKQEIIRISKAVNARVYIHPTKRSFKEVSRLALQTAVYSFTTENYQGLKSIFSTAAGKSFVTCDKKYIVDLDDIDLNTPEGKERYENVVKTLFEIRGTYGPNSDKVLYTVPTKSGIHIIAKAFDVGSFQKIYPNIDVHKNNPTLLYYSWEE